MDTATHTYCIRECIFTHSVYMWSNYLTDDPSGDTFESERVPLITVPGPGCNLGCPLPPACDRWRCVWDTAPSSSTLPVPGWGRVRLSVSAHRFNEAPLLSSLREEGLVR